MIGDRFLAVRGIVPTDHCSLITDHSPSFLPARTAGPDRAGPTGRYYAMQNNSTQNSYELIFWDRRAELAALGAWRAAAPRLAVIHGRRRLGKTPLLRQWLGRAAGVYVQAN